MCHPNFSLSYSKGVSIGIVESHLLYGNTVNKGDQYFTIFSFHIQNVVKSLFRGIILVAEISMTKIR